MSFASDVKNELCRVPLGRHCCAVAEAYGVLLYCHTFTTREIRIVTACDAFAERLPKLFRRAFGAHFALPAEEKTGGRHVLTITDRAAIETVFAAFGADLSRTVAHHINEQELPPRAHHGARERQPRDGRPAHGAGLCRAQHRPRREHRALF